MIFIPFFFGFFALWAAIFVFWILKIVEVVQIPDGQYRAAHTDKVTWVLVVVLVGFIGALIWQFAKRNDVVAMRGYAVPPTYAPQPAPIAAPAGWYPEGTGTLRYWDGAQWTEHRHPVQPPPPSQ